MAPLFLVLFVLLTNISTRIRQIVSETIHNRFIIYTDIKNPNDICTLF